MVTSSFPRIESLEEEFNHIDTIEEPPIAQRMGIMTAFWSFEEFIRYYYSFIRIDNNNFYVLGG